MIDFYHTMGINTCPMDDNLSTIEKIDLELRKKMTTQFDYSTLAENIKQTLVPGSLWLFEDEFSMSYSVFCFPDSLTKLLGYRYFFAGPMFFHVPNLEELKQRLFQNRISPNYHQDFLMFFNNVPAWPSSDFWNQIHTFYLTQLCDAPPQVFSLAESSSPVSFFPPIVPETALPFQPDVAMEALAKRYTQENNLINAVAAGNIDKATDYLYRIQTLRLSPRTNSPVRDRKNMLIILNTLLRKAAEIGGVHPIHIDSLSRQLAIQIESSYNMEQLLSISRMLVRKYCILVKNYSRKPYSALVSTCMDTIDFYYNSELSLASLSVLCSVSKGHLAATFKKETGMTVTDYINQTRIKQSLILLNTTNLSISEIAAQCGFSDVNYFSRTFRKLQEQTPSQYRKHLLENKNAR